MNLLSTVRDAEALHNFELIHGGNRYGIDKNLLTSVSPKFLRLILSQPSTTSLEIPNINGDLNEFIDILYGKEIRIHMHNCRFLNFMARFFEIEKLEKATTDIHNKTATVAELISYLDDLIANGQECDDIARRLAANIKIIENSESWKNASMALIEKVLSHMREKDRNNFIHKTVKENPERGSLVKLISCQAVRSILETPSVDLNMCVPQLYAYIMKRRSE